MIKQKGFTLIELMVVIAIIAVLVTIALPSYREYVKRGNRRAAQSTMMDIINRQQQFFVANRFYGATADLCPSVPPDVAANYTCAITVGTTPVPSFTITFTPTGNQVPDVTLTVNDLGVKTPADKW